MLQDTDTGFEPVPAFAGSFPDDDDALSGQAAAPSPFRRSVAPLQGWRLRRVLAHIEANIEETVTLADLAAAAGLSPMYFAGQFRIATGLRPHEFVLRRRIEHAQELLADPRAKLADVALAVGFQTQAHFTTVFGRFVGETPHRWRLNEAGRGRNENLDEPLRDSARPSYAPGTRCEPHVHAPDCSHRAHHA